MRIGALTGGGIGTIELGPANNIFGATSGDTNLNSITIAANLTASEATRDAYETANPSWIDDYTDTENLIILYYLDAGDGYAQYQRRVGSNWRNQGFPVVAVKGDPGTATDFSSITTKGDVVAIGGGPSFSPVSTGIISDEDSKAVTFPAPTKWANAIAANSGIEDVCFSNTQRNYQQHFPFRRAELSSSDYVQNKPWSGDTQTLIVRQAVDTETLVNPTFDLTVDAGEVDGVRNDGIRIAAFQVNFASPATGARLIIKRNTQIVYEFTAGDFSSGLQMINLMSDPGIAGEPGFIDVLDGDTYSLSVENASLLGNTSNIPYYALTFRAWNYSDMAHVDDILQSDWNEADTSSKAHILNKPTIPNDESIEDIVGNMVTGNNESGISVTYDDTNGKLDFVVSSAVFNAPRITNFSIDIPSRVDLDTNLNVQKTLTFDLMHPANIQGDLTLEVTTGDNKTITTPFTEGENTKSVTLSGIVTSVETTVVLRLIGTDTMSGSISSNSVTIDVRELNQHEYIYYGQKTDNVFGTVDVSTLSRIEAQSGTLTISIGPLVENSYPVIVAPLDHAITRINNSDTGVNEFTSYPIAGTIQVNSVTSNVRFLDHAISSAASGLTFNYQITVG